MMLETLRQIERSPDKGGSLGRLGRERAVADLSWPVVANQHHRFFVTACRNYCISQPGSQIATVEL